MPQCWAVWFPWSAARCIFAAVVAFRKKKASSGSGVNYSFKKILPWFILGFFGTSLLNTLGVISGSSATFTTEAGKFFIVVALSAFSSPIDLACVP
ncbi:MAG: putative sulfate exporter family transporter [Clostridia bacterium]|nr:putative sulfate exporter family transporter [Clostridia bacterium]